MSMTSVFAGASTGPRCDSHHQNPIQELAMTTTQTGDAQTGASTGARYHDMKLEVVVIPVSDADRTKQFYPHPGLRLDADIVGGDEPWVAQFSQPGPGCTIQIREPRHRGDGRIRTVGRAVVC